MHDIRMIRDDPDAFDAGLKRRGLAPRAADLLALDERRRHAATELQAALARRNEASKAIGAAKAQKREEDAQALLAEVAGLKDRIPALEDAERTADTALAEALAGLPNLPAADVPDGADESGNVERAAWGSPREGDFSEHPDFAGPLGLDFESAPATWALPRARPMISKSGCPARPAIARFRAARTAAISRPGG